MENAILSSSTKKLGKSIGENNGEVASESFKIELFSKERLPNDMKTI